jgi:two-component system KDP operon response regulator KdpE
MLRKMCCEVTSVQSGSGAVWILEEGIELFDLLVIDLSITDIDGVDLIEMIRKKMNLCTPILILTATECSNPVAQRALSSGGESCELMEKPFDHSTFASIISRLLCITL